MGIIDGLLSGLGLMRPAAPRAAHMVDVDHLPSAITSWPNQGAWPAWWDGEKFPTGFGPTVLFTLDYWTLRERSAQLFTTSLHAAGLIKRIVTSIINSGLNLEATPVARILGLADDYLAEWSEDVEARWELWAQTPSACDFRGEYSFGALQRIIYAEALIEGDLLVTARYGPTRVPQVQVISGRAVMDPPMGVRITPGNQVQYGIETDPAGRQVAYHVRQPDGSFKRLPAWGEKSGRRLAWMVYGSEKRLDQVRGLPLLHLVLQSIKELDRYRDAALRRAVINSIMAGFVKKTQNMMGSNPITGGAVRKDSVTAPGVDNDTRTFNISKAIPGVFIETLQVGEEPVAFEAKIGADDFAKFENAIIAAIAWAHEMPPTILTLGFNSNYSASRAEIIEFDVYLQKERSRFAEMVCIPVYQEWLIAMILARRINAPGAAEAWRDPMQYETAAAWVGSDWFGMIKPAIDPVKEVNGIKGQLEIGAITHARSTRQLTGMKWSRNMPVLKRENAALADAMRPLLELKREFGAKAVDGDTAALAAAAQVAEDAARAVLEDAGIDTTGKAG